MVDQAGTISLADHNIYISKANRGQALVVTYDLTQHCFVTHARDHAHASLKCFSLPVISPQYIMGLDGITAGGGGY